MEEADGMMQRHIAGSKSVWACDALIHRGTCSNSNPRYQISSMLNHIRNIAEFCVRNQYKWLVLPHDAEAWFTNWHGYRRVAACFLLLIA